ncbi:uncharacterized protein BJ171DRAFT_293947 [Polychytrium aggregatum]|uniref:uncharacterized protein n=1 Tax=Polychytrium aggregatum TaxID=110093 RepID=UPI0022FE744A|nr:uncharacterized protein BJ171DRAFT_293947 [Polychytrium aggregatum]KAI9207249.1 hypothetical protein BJ171DRAFT_293947 [Polychytrium aggregatum]
MPEPNRKRQAARYLCCCSRCVDKPEAERLYCRATFFRHKKYDRDLLDGRREDIETQHPQAHPSVNACACPTAVVREPLLLIPPDPEVSTPRIEERPNTPSIQQSAVSSPFGYGPRSPSSHLGQSEEQTHSSREVLPRASLFSLSPIKAQNGLLEGMPFDGAVFDLGGHGSRQRHENMSAWGDPVPAYQARTLSWIELITNPAPISIDSGGPPPNEVLDLNLTENVMLDYPSTAQESYFLGE